MDTHTEAQFMDAIKAHIKDPKVDMLVSIYKAIHLAFKMGELDVIKALLSHPQAGPSDGYDYVLGMVSMYGHLDVVSFLLSALCL